MRKERILRWVASGLIVIAAVLSIGDIATSNVTETNQTITKQTETKTEIKTEIKEEPEISITEIAVPQVTQAQTAWEASKVNPADFGIKDTYINKQYVEYVKEITAKYFPNLEVSLVISIIEAESSGRAHLVNSKGCKGLMQVYEKWHRARMEKYGVTDLLDPYSNILIGCDILNDCLKEWNGNLPAALMRYNGSKNIQQKIDSGNYTAYANKVLKRAEELEYYY